MGASQSKQPESGSSSGQQYPPECPMHEGGAGKNVSASTSAASTASAGPGAGSGTGGPPKECPMHESGGSGSGAKATGAAVPPECPMHEDGKDGASSSGPVYNVYSQIVDPSNNMPAKPAQGRAEGQAKDLSTHRVQSTIPKGGMEGTWLYPSPQMFYNALVRKHKAQDVTEDDMESVVTIHNRMNERTWAQVKDWEMELHGDVNKGKDTPRLRRFMGRPNDLSPKAQLRAWLGMGYPFDRHDWFVDRGDGTQHRYVIDYFFNAEANEKGEDPIRVDVRPALDSFDDYVDRLRRFPERLVEAFKLPSFYADGRDPSQIPKEVNAAMGQRERPAPESVVPPLARKIDEKCGKLRAALEAATDESERAKVFLGLSYCMGSVACPVEANDLFQELSRSAENGETDPDKEEQLFQRMTNCVMHKVKEDAAAARGEAQGAVLQESAE